MGHPRGHHGHHDLLHHLPFVLLWLPLGFHLHSFHLDRFTLPLPGLGLFDTYQTRFEITPRTKYLCPDLLDSCTDVGMVDAIVIQPHSPINLRFRRRTCGLESEMLDMVCHVDMGEYMRDGTDVPMQLDVIGYGAIEELGYRLESCFRSRLFGR